MAIDEPEHVRAIMAILGHSTQAISEKHYNQARCREASRRHMKVIADLKRGFAKKRSS